LSFDATFEESVKVRAEAVTRTVQKKPAVTASIVTARAPETARPVLESATRAAAPRPQQKVAAREDDFIAEVDGRKITADDLRSLLRSTRR
jgi:predicted flap endonuclease-1-like 5' DNA nuclease